MNAREELLELLEKKLTLVAGNVRYEDNFGSLKINLSLKKGHSSEDLEKFFELLNFEYDDGFNSQKLFGTLWFQDGSWAIRGEYDGSEWWERRSVPEIPESLL